MGEMERRMARRYGCGGRVEIPRVYTRVPLYGVVVDVSEGGCGICLPSGAELEPEETEAEQLVELRFRGSYLSFRARGEVRRQHRHWGYCGGVVGMRFVEMSARARADIRALVRDQEELRVGRGVVSGAVCYRLD